MGDISMTIAGEEDVPALHALVESAYRGDSARRGWTHEADLLADARTDEVSLKALLVNDRERVLLFRRDGALIGCAQISRKSGEYAYFGMFAVDPALQNTGLGKIILRAAEEQAVAIFGITKMEMTVIAGRAELISYYERRGYTRTDEVRPFPVELDPPLYFTVLVKSLL